LSHNRTLPSCDASMQKEKEKEKEKEKRQGVCRID
jgi:hypothetical protein